MVSKMNRNEESTFEITVLEQNFDRKATFEEIVALNGSFVVRNWNQDRLEKYSQAPFSWMVRPL